MEKKVKIVRLNKFLKKVQQLRGFGAMEAYNLVSELGQLIDLPEATSGYIIDDFASPKTWRSAQSKLIDKVETEIGDIHNH